MIVEVGIMRPNIEVMCMVKSQYALSHGHCLVLLLFLDVFAICCMAHPYF